MATELKEFPTTEQKGDTLGASGASGVSGDSFSGTQVGGYVLINSEILERITETINEIKEKFKTILEEGEILKFKEISDIEAKKEITNFILREKKKGIKRMRAIDIVKRLKLPAYQVEKIIDGFLKEKKLFEI